jgi:hypothetical protein
MKWEAIWELQNESEAQWWEIWDLWTNSSYVWTEIGALWEENTTMWMYIYDLEGIVSDHEERITQLENRTDILENELYNLTIVVDSNTQEIVSLWLDDDMKWAAIWELQNESIELYNNVTALWEDSSNIWIEIDQLWLDDELKWQMIYQLNDTLAIFEEWITIPHIIEIYTDTLQTSTSVVLNLTTDKAAFCRWDLEDVGYDYMGDVFTGGQGTTSHWTTVTASEGYNTFYVRCYDSEGPTGDALTSSADVTFTVDSIPPEAMVYSPVNGITSGVNTRVLVVTNEDATCQYRLDAGSYAPMTTTGSMSHSQDLTGLTGGSHTVYVTCTDTAGNAGSEVSETWTVTTSGPVTSSVLINGLVFPEITADYIIINATVIASGSNGNVGGAEYFIDPVGTPTPGTGTALAPTDGTFDSTQEDVTVTIDISGLTDGPHVIYVHGTDAANWGAYEAGMFTIVDTIPPNGLNTCTMSKTAISYYELNTVNGNTTISCTITDTNLDKVELDVLFNGVVVKTVPLTSGGGVLQAKGLSDGIYTLRVRAEDEAGNTASYTIPGTLKVDGKPPHTIVLTSQWIGSDLVVNAIIEDEMSEITDVEICWDESCIPGTGTLMTITGSAFKGTNWEANATYTISNAAAWDWSVPHFVLVHGKDSLDNWELTATSGPKRNQQDVEPPEERETSTSSGGSGGGGGGGGSPPTTVLETEPEVMEETTTTVEETTPSEPSPVTEGYPETAPEVAYDEGYPLTGLVTAAGNNVIPLGGAALIIAGFGLVKLWSGKKTAKTRKKAAKKTVKTKKKKAKRRSKKK